MSDEAPSLAAGSGTQPTDSLKPVARARNRIFKPYYDLQRSELTCPACGWKGIGEELALSEILEASAILEYVCPQCGVDIAFTVGPTIAESRAHWDQVSELDRTVVQKIEKRTAKNATAPQTHSRPRLERIVWRVYLGLIAGIFLAYIITSMRK